MNEKISAQDELAILKILSLAGPGLTLPEVEQKINLGEPKIAAVLDALAHKGHVQRNALTYCLQKPLAYFNEPEEQ